jgi:hypothetical protein
MNVSDANADLPGGDVPRSDAFHLADREGNMQLEIERMAFAERERERQLRSEEIALETQKAALETQKMAARTMSMELQKLKIMTKLESAKMQMDLAVRQMAHDEKMRGD